MQPGNALQRQPVKAGDPLAHPPAAPASRQAPAQPRGVARRPGAAIRVRGSRPLWNPQHRARSGAARSGRTGGGREPGSPGESAQQSYKVRGERWRRGGRVGKGRGRGVVGGKVVVSTWLAYTYRRVVCGWHIRRSTWLAYTAGTYVGGGREAGREEWRVGRWKGGKQTGNEREMHRASELVRE